MQEIRKMKNKDDEDIVVEWSKENAPDPVFVALITEMTTANKLISEAIRDIASLNRRVVEGMIVLDSDVEVVDEEGVD